MEIREIGSDEMFRMKEIFEAAWKEVGDDYPLDVDWETYRALIDLGEAVWLGVFDGEDPVGYVSILFIVETFNPALKSAYIDSIYVEAAHRPYWSGRLIKEAIRRSDGCRRLVLGVSDEMMTMFIKRGFRKVENTIELILEKP
jgi:hypothetical protein